VFLRGEFDALEEGGGSFAQSVEVGGFMVGGAVCPTAMEDANPFEGEGADGGMVFLAAFDLLLVEGASPDAVTGGVVCELMEGLSQEGGTGPSPVYPGGVAAAFGDRSDPAVFLEVLCASEAGAIGAEGYEKSWGDDFAGTGEVSEEGGVGMGVDEVANGAVVCLEWIEEGAELCDEHVDLEDVGLDDGVVGGEGGGLLDDPDALLDEVGSSTGVAIVEFAHGLGVDGLDVVKGGPLGKEIAGETRVKPSPDEFDGLREIGLEGGAEGVCEGLLLVDGLASVLDEEGELPGVFVVGEPGGESVAVEADEVEEELGVGAVVLGPAGVEGFSEAGEGFGVDGVEDEEVVFHQGVEERSSELFEGDGDRSAAESPAKGSGPVVERFGGVLDDAVLRVGGVVRA